MFNFDFSRRSRGSTQTSLNDGQSMDFEAEPRVSTSTTTFTESLSATFKDNLMRRPRLSSFGSWTSNNSSSIPIPTNSWGMLALNTLRDSEEMDDLVELLTGNDKATLFCPVAQPHHPATIIDREFLDDHIVIRNDSDPRQATTLSGIRGLFEQDRFVMLGFVERKSTGINSETSSVKSLPPFEIDASSLHPTHPSVTILATHVGVSLKGQTIAVNVVQKPVSKKDVELRLTQLGEFNLSQRNSMIDELSAASADDMTASDMSPKLVQNLRTFVDNFRAKPPSNPETASHTFQQYMDHIQDTLSTYFDGNVLTEAQIEEKMEWVERYLCTELYTFFFSPSNSDDILHDEALESRIAALNLLELSLENLGVKVESRRHANNIHLAVKKGGEALQMMTQRRSPRDKVEVLVICHRIIVDTIDDLAEHMESKKALSEDLALLDNISKLKIDVLEHWQDEDDNELETPTQARRDTKAVDAGVLQANDIENQSDAVVSQQQPAEGERTDPDTTAAEQNEDDNNSRKPSITIIEPSQDETESSPTAVDTDPTLQEYQSTKTPSHMRAEEAESVSADATNTVEDKPDVDNDDDMPDISSSADLLLPLLIFTIVKSNPPKFISNLKFIHRFRMHEGLIGEASFCLTNMMAAVSYLETTNLIGLGLASGKVYSNVTDLDASDSTSSVSHMPNITPMSFTTAPVANGNNPSSRVPLTRAFSSTPDIVGVAGGGLKALSGAVEGAGKVLGGLGKFWQGPDLPPPGHAHAHPSYHLPRSIATSATDSLSNIMERATVLKRGDPRSKELKEMGAEETGSVADTPVVPALIEGRFSTPRRPGSIRTPSSGSVSIGHIPVERFLHVQASDLRVGEVEELLEAYKQLVKAYKQKTAS